MLQAGPQARRLSPRRPGALERRDERKTAFILQCEACAQLATLFLSWVAHSPSIVPQPGRLAGRAPAAAAGCSSPSGASHARLHWGCSAPRTIARSPVRCGPASSNSRRIQKRKPRAPEPSSGASLASLTIASVVRTASELFSSSDVCPLPANGLPSAESLPVSQRPPSAVFHSSAAPILWHAAPRVARQSLCFACPHYGTL
jgi:hypothetical protein